VIAVVVDVRALNRRIKGIEARAAILKAQLAVGAWSKKDLSQLVSDLADWIRDFEDLNNDPELQIAGDSRRLRGMSAHQLEMLMDADALFNRRLPEFRRASTPKSA
jgi:hypothetical protein